MSKPDGGYAYPWREEDGQGGFMDHPGMTLRAWFAGQASIGIAAHITGDDEFQKASLPETARRCCEFSDAMIAALGEK